MNSIIRYLLTIGLVWSLARNLYAQEPSVQVSNLSVSNITCNSALLQWSNGNGDRRLIVIKEGSAVDGNPIDGTAYSANPSFGNGQQIGTGNYVVFAGPVNLVNVQNLKENTTYHIKAYEYNNNGGSPDYYPIAPPVASFTTYGFNIDFDFSFTDSCWYNNSYTFSNNSTTNIPSPNYVWNFGDGSTSNASDPTHSYATGGEFKVSLTIFPNFGCQDTFESNIIVIPQPNIDIGVDDSAQCLSGNEFQFINNTTYPNINKLGLVRTWDFGDGTTAITNRPKKTYETPNPYRVFNYVEMIYNNIRTGCKDTSFVDLVVYPDPTGAIVISDSVNCIGKNSITFQNLAGNIIDYNWEFGDGNTSTSDAPTHNYSMPGNYQVIHTAESSFGCISRDTIDIYARNRRISSFVGLSGPVCNSLTPINLVPSDPEGEFFGRGVNGFTYTPDIVGRDTVRYIISDTFCPDTTQLIVDVLSSPQPDLGPDQNLCNQTVFTLQESISGNYLWSNDSTSPSIQVNRTGVYWLEVDDGICRGRDSIYVFFGLPPALPLIGDTIICKNSFIRFDLDNPDTDYLWNDGSTDSFKVITKGGFYSVTATNPCGNTSVSFNINQLTEDCNVLIPSAFSPNSDGLNDVFRPILLSDSIQVNQFIIFNNYGEILFEGEGQNITWDGKANGTKVPGNQNYFYLLYYTLPLPGETQKGTLQGSVFILE